MTWAPESWRAFEARHLPTYDDPDALAAAERELRAYPALVNGAEAAALKAAIADAQAGRAFLLQGGDCAESFAEFSPDNIASTYRLMQLMGDAVAAASGLPVIRLGRIAGQFAKPRSTDLEAKSGTALPAYRGDIVNGIAFDAAARRPDPERMFRAYAQASATLAHLRTLSSADDAPFYTSHEALLLPFEEALVRRSGPGSYASSAHLLWIGHRTRFDGSAHVEFARGLANPLGIKCGPGLEPDALLRLLDRLDPAREPGRVTLIARMGHADIAALLPPLMRAVRREGRPVLWSCDPMHGNTVKAANGYKTRPLGRILAETSDFFSIARSEAVVPGGVHVEMTGRDVTECTGGAGEAPVTERDLGDRYHTHCDPRLNARQALELAALVAERLAEARRTRAA
ncbi:MAG: 3-deoxy-7-phosphoheptulonate synthase [Allosphingosinicella sp.]|uniref:3-deoxy-7-phosphoheptulonate synthase n=1 Tax=Allosphingosinicella sp. TaxID=2823234 RepID=UPI00394EF8A3